MNRKHKNVFKTLINLFIRAIFEERGRGTPTTNKFIKMTQAESSNLHIHCICVAWANTHEMGTFWIFPSLGKWLFFNFFLLFFDCCLTPYSVYTYIMANNYTWNKRSQCEPGLFFIWAMFIFPSVPNWSGIFWENVYFSIPGQLKKCLF